MACHAFPLGVFGEGAGNADDDDDGDDDGMSCCYNIGKPRLPQK